MKKIILAALAAIVSVGAQAQTASDVVRYSLGVPQVISITTEPGNANFMHPLTESQLLNGKNLETVTWNVKSNGNWKASTMWSFMGLASSNANNSLLEASVTNFRNAMLYSTDNGASWQSIQPHNIFSANPIPGYGNMPPTTSAGHEVVVLAKLGALNYTVVPGTYMATTIITVTAL